MNKLHLVGLLAGLLLVLVILQIRNAHADILINVPGKCEFNIPNLPVSDDENFKRIYEMNNQNLIRSCQEYQLKKMEQLKRDTY